MRPTTDHPTSGGTDTGNASVPAGAGPVGSLRSLLEGAIDYAGLFPPAGLPMSQAVANYAAYLSGPHAWALGRFILPLVRLDEFADALSTRFARSSAQAPWRLSALVGPGDLAAAMTMTDAFNQRHQETALVDTLEFKAATTSSIVEAARLADKRFIIFQEIPLAGGSQEFLLALARVGTRVKIRTGGVTANAFPEPVALAQFLEQCAAAGISFKATAGLHHPLRGPHPLTYGPDSPATTMHGFVNVLLAAAFALGGWKSGQLADLLNEQSPAAFRFDPDSASWRGHRLPKDILRASRVGFLRSFGSCSFEEPVRELQELGWLPLSSHA